jgi:hypothetical protein
MESSLAMPTSGRAGFAPASRYATPKLGAYTALAGLGLIAALVVGRPELAALAAPFALVLVAGLSLASEPRLERTAVELVRWRTRPSARR